MEYLKRFIFRNRGSRLHFLCTGSCLCLILLAPLTRSLSNRLELTLTWLQSWISVIHSGRQVAERPVVHKPTGKEKKGASKQFRSSSMSVCEFIAATNWVVNDHKGRPFLSGALLTSFPTVHCCFLNMIIRDCSCTRALLTHDYSGY